MALVSLVFHVTVKTTKRAFRRPGRSAFDDLLTMGDLLEETFTRDFLQALAFTSCMTPLMGDISPWSEIEIDTERTKVRVHAKAIRKPTTPRKEKHERREVPPLRTTASAPGISAQPPRLVADRRVLPCGLASCIDSQGSSCCDAAGVVSSADHFRPTHRLVASKPTLVRPSVHGQEPARGHPRTLSDERVDRHVTRHVKQGLEGSKAREAAQGKRVAIVHTPRHTLATPVEPVFSGEHRIARLFADMDEAVNQADMDEAVNQAKQSLACANEAVIKAEHCSTASSLHVLRRERGIFKPVSPILKRSLPRLTAAVPEHTWSHGHMVHSYRSGYGLNPLDVHHMARPPPIVAALVAPAAAPAAAAPSSFPCCCSFSSSQVASFDEVRRTAEKQRAALESQAEATRMVSRVDLVEGHLGRTAARLEDMFASSDAAAAAASGHHFASTDEMRSSWRSSRDEAPSSTAMEAQPAAAHVEAAVTDREGTTLEALPCLASPPRLAKLNGVYGSQTSLGAALNSSRSQRLAQGLPIVPIAIYPSIPTTS